MTGKTLRSNSNSHQGPPQMKAGLPPLGEHLRCVSEIVVVSDLRSECRDVLGQPCETATDAFGVCLDAAFNGSGQAQKGSLPDQGGTAITPADGLQLLARE